MILHLATLLNPFVTSSSFFINAITFSSQTIMSSANDSFTSSSLIWVPFIILFPYCAGQNLQYNVETKVIRAHISLLFLILRKTIQSFPFQYDGSCQFFIDAPLQFKEVTFYAYFAKRFLKCNSTLTVKKKQKKK